MSSTLARALTVFQELVDLPPPVQDARLAALSSGELRDAVVALLEADRGASGVLASAALDGGELVGQLLADAEDEIPETLLGRRVLGVLGSGGMGVVYEAEEDEPHRRVAIKVAHAWLRSDALVRQFRAEAQAMAGLTHPAIPHVIEAATEPELILVMEKVEGVGLLEAARVRTPRACVQMMVSVCEGVDHAHRGGVLHRDLKPGNVLVDATGQPRILDFGLAGSLGEASAVVGGTPAYMAPEQRHEDVLDRRTDVHALGVVLLAVVRGQEVRPGPLPLHEVEDADLRAVIDKATQQDPEARYATADGLAEDLRRWLASQPVRARRAPPGHWLHLWWRRSRSRAAWALATAAVFGLVIGGVVVAQQLAQQARESRARASWAVAQDRIQAHTQAGEHAEAAAVFQAFAASPDALQGGVLTTAWLAEAHRRGALHDADGELEALTHAWQSSQGAERDVVLGELGSLALREWDLERLGRLAPRMGPGVDPALRQQAWLARRDLASAVRIDTPLTPVLQALSGATRTTHQPRYLEPLDHGLLLVDYDRHQLARLEPTPDLRVRDRAEPDGMRFMHDLPRVLTTQPELTLLARDSDLGVGAFRYTPGEHGRARVQALWHAPGLHVMDGAAVDLDGDGEREVYYGVGPYERTLLRHTPSGPVHASPDLRRVRSDVQELLPVDLDGDGQDELAVAVGPWTAYDVRVLEGGQAGAPLRLRARRQLGVVSSLAELPRPDGPSWLVASKEDTYPSQGAFPEREGFGPRPGLYVLELDGDALREVAAVPLPVRPDVTGLVVRRVVVGDLDGDGLQDLAASVFGRGESGTWLVRQTAPGVFVGAVISGVTPLAALQVDDDSADELVVAHRQHSGTAWVLGAGTQPLDVDVGASDLRALQVRDAVLQGAVGRVHTLVEVGADAPAARTLEALHARARDARTQDQLAERIAVLWLRAGDPVRARRWLRRLADSDDAQVAADGRRRLARVCVELHDLDCVTRWIPDPVPPELAWVAGASTPGASVSTDFDGPLDPAWRIHAPDAVARRGGALVVGSTNQGIDLLSLPLRTRGDQLTLELHIRDVQPAEAAEVRLRVRTSPPDPADATNVLDLTLDKKRLGDRLLPTASCVSPLSERLTAVLHDEPATLVLDLLRPTREVVCSVRQGGETRILGRYPMPAGVLGPGEHDLELRVAGMSHSWPGTLRAQARLDGLHLRGVALRDGAESELNPAHHAWIEGDPGPALRAYRQRSDAPTLHALAALDSGRLDEARRAFIRALSDRDPAFDRALRSRPQAILPLLWETHREPLVERLVQVWQTRLGGWPTQALGALLSRPEPRTVPGHTPAQLRLLLACAEHAHALGQDARAQRHLERILASVLLRPPRATDDRVLHAVHQGATELQARQALRRGDRASARRWLQEHLQAARLPDIRRDRLMKDAELGELVE